MPSCRPVRGVEAEKLHLLFIEIEDRGLGRAVNPAAGFARIDDQRITARLHLLLMCESVHDDAVSLDAARLHVTDIVNDQDPLASHLEAVRTLEQLRAESSGGTGAQSLLIAVVLAEHP